MNCATLLFGCLIRLRFDGASMGREVPGDPERFVVGDHGAGELCLLVWRVIRQGWGPSGLVGCSVQGAAGLAGARRAVRLVSVMKGVLSRFLVSLAGAGRGAVGNVGQGQAVAHMGFEPGLISGRPFDLSGCAASADP
jgi:hypothetical protein